MTRDRTNRPPNQAGTGREHSTRSATVSGWAASESHDSPVSGTRRMATVSDISKFQRRRQAAQPHTVIFQVSNVRTDGEVHRHIGVNEDITFRELLDVLVVCFELGNEPAPWDFYLHIHGRGDRIAPGHKIKDFVDKAGKQVDFTWGLWDFSLQTVDVYPRDEGTPQALCIGGSGSFPGTSFDITEINARLTGRDTITKVLASASPQVKNVITRSKLYDFVPLLQAMDLEREPELERDVEKQVETLPREVSNQGTDAFWSLVLGLACMSGEETTDAVIETLMDALGWVEDDGSHMHADDVRALCKSSLAVLQEIGAVGDTAMPIMDRIEVYRALLRGA